MKVKLIANPASAKGKCLRKMDRTLSSLRRHGLSPDVQITERPGDAFTIAREACESFDVIAGLGGDGTMNEIASAIRGTDVPLAVYPAGTGNDFIKALGKDFSYESISSSLAEGRTARMDMASVNGRHLINILGIGFDAEVSAENARIKRLSGTASYAYALLRSLTRYRHHPLTLSLNGEDIEARALFLSVGNGPVCGGGFRLTPSAVPDDGLLDITLISDIPFAALPFHIHKVFNGRISETPYSRTFRAEKLRISAPAPLPAHIDGDIISPYVDRYDIEVLPGALTVIRP